MLFTPPSKTDIELFGDEMSDGALMHARRTARGFARGRSRSHDFAFIEECEAEAVFIVTEMILTTLDSIVEKYPILEERLKFYRMSVGYHLKGYWAHRATSTLSFLRKKGINEKVFELYEAAASLTRINLDAQVFELTDDLLPTELDKRVVEFYLMQNSREIIAVKCGITPKRVKRILRRLKRKLKRRPE